MTDRYIDRAKEIMLDFAREHSDERVVRKVADLRDDDPDLVTVADFLRSLAKRIARGG